MLCLNACVRLRHCDIEQDLDPDNPRKSYKFYSSNLVAPWNGILDFERMQQKLRTFEKFNLTKKRFSVTTDRSLSRNSSEDHFSSDFSEFNVELVKDIEP